MQITHNTTKLPPITAYHSYHCEGPVSTGLDFNEGSMVGFTVGCQFIVDVMAGLSVSVVGFAVGLTVGLVMGLKVGGNVTGDNPVPSSLQHVIACRC